jgi:hypothetical protein
VEAARERGLVVGIDLDGFPDRRTRVNNGTPRPITVHNSFLENHCVHDGIWTQALSIFA